MSATVALLCVLVAFACTLADSAQRRCEDMSTAPSEATLEVRRALAIARLAALVGAGVATRTLVVAYVAAPVARVALFVVAALCAVAVGEVAARELGDALGALGRAGAERLLPVGRAVAALLAPIVLVSRGVDRALARLLPPRPPDDAAREEATEQFREIVAAEADVGGGERALIAGAFTLGDTQVSEVMVPRVDVVGVDRETPWAELVARVRSAQHARLPVYETTIDDVIGVVYAKDLLGAVVAGDEPGTGWQSLVRAAAFVPETKRIDEQLREFRATGNHLAVVVDEYGGTAGIVTIEDVLEEIVGEIRDERDDEDAPLEADGDRRFWASARLTLDELSSATGYDFEHAEVTTLGGLIYELLGRVPRNGERLDIGPFRVVVERVVRRRIQRVYLERRAEPADALSAEVDA